MRAADVVMTIDTGEVGMRGIGGHGHNDVLSFDLWAGGAPLLVDSGTYTYTAASIARQRPRPTQSPNAVVNDVAASSRLGGSRWLLLIENDAHPSVVEWTSGADGDRLVASHDGYTRLREPVIHTRAIDFDKVHRVWRIVDTLEGTGAHLVELFLHPGVPFALE